jgi:heme/copper-type cytochrome/quinol oxidase subunit 3
MDGTIPSQPPRYARRQPLLPNGVMGMLIFITAEIMFFAGMLSAFTIVRATNLPASWPPPGQPMLPASATAVNTAALMLSGVALVLAQRAFSKDAKAGAGALGAALARGAAPAIASGP